MLVSMKMVLKPEISHQKKAGFDHQCVLVNVGSGTGLVGVTLSWCQTGPGCKAAFEDFRRCFFNQILKEVSEVSPHCPGVIWALHFSYTAFQGIPEWKGP